ncbi:MAG: pectinesterase family protein [Firmicutes bacterium]|nr:pectinesterase family protein [[Eubacterium] siraeum]MCM1487413.1 pectinesterase family protein [Bacillota bacterium]
MKTVKVTPKDKLSEILQRLEPGTRILLSEGVYREKIEIKTPTVEFVGEAPEKTVIVWGDYAKKLDPKGVELNTFRTYTAAVLANGVTMKDLSVVNDSNKPEEKGQEVALTVYGDDFRAENCRFISTQDTVFCGPLPPDLIERYEGFLKEELRGGNYQRQIFRNCYIAGNVDFIFGCGDALFEKCEVRSVFDVRGHGYVAAPAHSLSQKIGFVFNECDFTCEEKVAENTVFLARPWRDYGKASFIHCRYGKHISREGFNKWNDTDRDKTARFSEWGVDREGRAPWSRELDDTEKNLLLNYFK